LKRGQEVVAIDRTIVSPTYVPVVVHSALDLLRDGESGIWHLTNLGAVSWHELAREAAAVAKLGTAGIRFDEDAIDADTSLSSGRGLLLRPLDQALRDFASDSEALRLIA